MGFVESTLLPNETIIYRTHLSKYFLVLKTITGLLFALLFFKIPAISAFVILLVLGSWLDFWTSDFVVTNRRVLIKVGILRRRTFEMLVAKIESISFNQGVIDRFLLGGMGTITIIGSGGSREAFKYIDNVIEFRRQIQMQVDTNP